MIEDQSQLSRLTLRQLRYMASDLGVPLYSRKSKESLIKAIGLYKSKREADQQILRNNKESNFEPQEGSTVVFLPRDPQWAYVFWEISESDRKKAQEQGANRIYLRLADVTGMTAGTAHPHTLQEVPVDSHSTEWYLPIPLSDREYRVELGYRFSNKWKSLAFSSAALVPSLHPSDQILDQFVPFSLEEATTSPITTLQSSTSSTVAEPETRDNQLHERLYQTATKHFRETRVGSEAFQEQDNLANRKKNLNDSGIGLWASGRNESGIGGIAPRERSFWLVADAELIVYGSTDPAARLTIGGEEVPLSKDGTFRLQVPFRDGQQKYPITAISSDGEQKRNITLNFERNTPEDNTITKQHANSEWF